MRQVRKKATLMDRPCAGHLFLRFRMGTSEFGPMRNSFGGCSNRTGLSKRVLKLRGRWFMMTTAEHSLNEPDDFAVAFRQSHGSNCGGAFEAGKAGCHPATLTEMQKTKETGRLAI